jgi:predicted ATPase
MTLRLQVQNFRALKNVDLTIDDVVCVVGVNGAGKTTLLFALRFLRIYLTRSLDEARARVGGNIHSRTIGDGENVVFGVSQGRCAWTLKLRSRGAQLAIVANEFTVDGEVPTSMAKLKPGAARLQLRAFMGLGDDEFEPGEEPIPAEVISEAREMLSAIANGLILYDPDLRSLRVNGSKASEYLGLADRAENAFAMLRRWHEQRPDRFRYEFVLGGLRAAMGHLVEDLDFESVGGSVFLRVWHHGDERGRAMEEESNGLLALLVTLTAVAEAKPGAIVAIDEPENGLHPFAIRRLVEAVTTWCCTHRVRVLFTSHSPVMLNQFRASPEKVIVVDADGEVRSLDQIRSREWLEGLLPGELYENLEFGSPIEEKPDL